jgi:outer membrane protein TolC
MNHMRRNSFRTRQTAWWVALIAMMAAPTAQLSAQTPDGTGLAPLPTVESVINRNTNPYSGSIPQGKATGDVIDLTVTDALDRGLKYNLGIFLSTQTTAEARAARLQTLSHLLPNLNGSFGEQITRTNLDAFGFKFPGFPSSVGPFSLTTVQATGTWEPLNASSIDRYRSSGQEVKAAEFSYKDARDTVVLAVGANYLLLIAQESRLEATQAELKTAEALYQLAEDQEAAGLVPNIDTLRARVQLQAQQEAVIEVENALEKQRIALARVIGLPIQQKYRLVDRVPHSDIPDVNVEGAVQLALETRSDYKAAQAQVHAAELRHSAAWKGYLPSVGVSGAYGVLGYNPANMAPNYTGAATLNIPVFQGGKVQADIAASDAQLKERQAQSENLRARIEQEVEVSILDLNAASKQVGVAKTGLDFAQQALNQSQDRFAAGVTNNVEVIQAQQQLASANDRYITALFAHNIAKVLLARSIGNAEQMIKQYMAGNRALPPSVVAPGPQTPPPANTPPVSPNPKQPNYQVKNR